MKYLILALCLFFVIPSAYAQPAETIYPLPMDNLLPITVILHHGSGETAVDNILLIVINQSTGKALKATLRPDLFPYEEFDAQEADSIETFLESIEDRLQISLEQYVCLEMSALESMKRGEAKDKSMWDLIGLGFSMLGSMKSNLPVNQAITTFQLVFAQKDDGIEIVLPDDTLYSSDEPDWDAMRKSLFDAMQKLL